VFHRPDAIQPSALEQENVLVTFDEKFKGIFKHFQVKTATDTSIQFARYLFGEIKIDKMLIAISQQQRMPQVDVMNKSITGVMRR